jgi:hypothetical protein
MRDEPPVLSEARPGLPEAADRVLAKALAKDPADRYGSCREFLGELRAALGEAQTAAAPPATAAAATVAAPRRARRPSLGRLRPNAGLLGALLLGLLLGAGIASAILIPGGSTSTKLVTRHETTTVENDFLRRLIPPPILGKCGSPGKQSTSYYVSYYCSPGNGADHVTYNLGIGPRQMIDEFRKRAQREGIQFFADGSFQPSGDCTVGERAIQYWVPRRGTGHTALDPGIPPGDRAKGWVLCHRTGNRSWIEWTDNRLNVYANAYGPEGQRLYDWWSRLAGPRPS